METDIHYQNQDWPLVSVIMPVRNEQRMIRRSLGTMLAQDYPADRLEFIIADGFSDDDTRAIIHEISQNDGRVRLVENPEHIMTTGFNRGLVAARGDIIIMASGHAEYAPDFVRRGVEILQRGEADCVGGPIETVGENEVAKAIALALSSRFGVGGGFRTGAKTARYVDTVAFGAYRREAMEKAGPLDEDMVRSQDLEYNYRLVHLGSRVMIAPGINARYFSRSSLRTLWRQYFLFGMWKVRVLQKYPEKRSPRLLLPPVFVVALGGTALLAPFSVVGRTLAGVVTGSYVVANLAASLLTARNNMKSLPFLPPAFATIHISYGIGFLVGIYKFWNRRKDRATIGQDAYQAAKNSVEAETVSHRS